MPERRKIFKPGTVVDLVDPRKNNRYVFMSHIRGAKYTNLPNGKYTAVVCGTADMTGKLYPRHLARCYVVRLLRDMEKWVVHERCMRERKEHEQRND